MTPDSSVTSTSTVGLPRESKISRAAMSTIAVILLLEVSGTRGVRCSARLGDAVDCDHGLQELGQVGEPYHVWPVRGSVVWVLVGFHEQRRAAHGHRGTRQHRHIFALAAGAVA